MAAAVSNSKIAYTSGLPATLFGKSELLSLQRIDIDFARRSIEVETVYTQTHEARSVPKSQTLTAT